MERLTLSTIIFTAVVAFLAIQKEQQTEKQQAQTQVIAPSKTNTIGSEFQRIRIANQLSMAEMATKIGLSESNIVSIEADRAVPSRELLFKFEDMFHCAINMDASIKP